MVAMQGTFNARQFTPKQVSESHAPGKFPFRITNTEITQNKEGTGGFLAVEFTSPSGTAIMRYNLWNPSPKAVEIAHGQLSALCYAVNIYDVNYGNEGKDLIGGQGMMEIGWQKGQEPTSNNPTGGYTEIKRVYNSQGVEPGKDANVAGVAGQPAAPLQQNPNGGWQQPSQPQAQPQAAPGGWQQPPAQTPVQPSQPQQQAPQGWTQGAPGAPPPTAPWGR